MSKKSLAVGEGRVEGIAPYKWQTDGPPPGTEDQECETGWTTAGNPYCKTHYVMMEDGNCPFKDTLADVPDVAIKEKKLVETMEESE